MSRRDGDFFFKQWREQVMSRCSNPERMNCLAPETLRRLVFSSDEVDAGDPAFVHIAGCAECTRDLDEFMQQRDAETKKVRGEHMAWKVIFSRWAVLPASLMVTAIVVIGAWFLSQHHTFRQQNPTEVASATINLGPEGISRGYAGPESSYYTLPRKDVELHLILPYFSSIGKYTVSISRTPMGSSVEARGTAIATNVKGHAELNVALELRSIKPGRYFLVTFREGDSAVSSYPVAVR